MSANWSTDLAGVIAGALGDHLQVMGGCVCRGDKVAISNALGLLHVATSKDDPHLRADMAYGMFDTRGKVSLTWCTPSTRRSVQVYAAMGTQVGPGNL
jgi:hypothetical protein